MWKHFSHRAAQFVAWHRRGIAAVTAALCVFSITSALAPASPPGTPVVVLTRAVAACAPIGADDVAVWSVPEAFVTNNAFTETAPVIGLTAVIALSPGTQLTPAAVLGASPPPHGMRHVPIRVTDTDLTKILHVGDRVTLIGIGPDGASSTIASSTRIAALPLGDAPGTLSTDSRGALLVLEIPEAQAPAAATASLQRNLSIIVG